MKFRIVFRAAGLVTGLVGLGMLTSVPVGWLMDDPPDATWRMLLASIIPIALGVVSLLSRSRMRDIAIRDGYGVVVASWLAATLSGALPYIFVQHMPAVDAWFESVSGFTTAGSSILTEIEALPKGLLYWRAMTHWLGGMGIVVLALAILPILGIGGMALYKAESPSPTSDQLAPRIAHTAKLLWGVYIVLSLAETLLLWPVMGLYDAWCHTCATVATGGFSTHGESIAYFHSAYVEWVIILFMFLASLNFALYLRLFTTSDRHRSFWRNEEFRFYTAIVVFAIATIVLSLAGAGLYSGSLHDRIRHASFAVLSLVSCTGFATEDYDLWPSYARTLLVLLMIMGGCVGSTSGGLKAMRLLLSLKSLAVNVKQNIFPHQVHNIRLNDQRVNDAITRRIVNFCVTYLIIIISVAMLLMVIEPKLRQAPPHGILENGESFSTIETAISASVTTIGGVGPGLADVGPLRNFAWMAPQSKVLLSLNMLIGRLELYAILILLLPGFWRQ